MSTPTTIYQLDKPAVSGDADAWGGLLNTDLDDLDTFIGKPRWKKNAPTVGATTTLDLSLANFFEFTVNQVTTLAFSNVPATLPDTTVPAIKVMLKITNGGAFAMSFPGSVTFPNGTPVFQTSGVDVLELVSYNAGTNWYAFLLHVPGAVYARASVYRTTNQAGSQGATITVGFDAERYDVGGMHDTVVNNSRLTVPTGQAGNYRITIGGRIDTTVVGSGDFTLTIRKNGSTTLRTLNYVPGANGANEGATFSFTITEPLVAADYVELLIDEISASSGGYNFIAGTTVNEFSIERI